MTYADSTETARAPRSEETTAAKMTAPRLHPRGPAQGGHGGADGHGGVGGQAGIEGHLAAHAPATGTTQRSIAWKSKAPSSPPPAAINAPRAGAKPLTSRGSGYEDLVIKIMFNMCCQLSATPFNLKA